MRLSNQIGTIINMPAISDPNTAKRCPNFFLYILNIYAYNKLKKNRFSKVALRMKKTVHTIAEQLGLAPSTISKVLNNTGNFSQATRDKVLKYTQEIGYVPAVSARVLKSNKSWSIGVVYTEESSVGLEHPFFVSVLQHFKAYIEKSGYELSFIVKRLGQHEMSYLGWCKNKKIDGVFLVVGSQNNPGIVELIESDIPCVSTDIFHEQLPIVLSDNDQGVELSLNYALSQGARQFGYITGPTTSRSLRNR